MYLIGQAAFAHTELPAPGSKLLLFCEVRLKGEAIGGISVHAESSKKAASLRDTAMV